MYLEPKKFFKRFLLLAVLTPVNFVVSFALVSSTNQIAIVTAGILVIGNLIFLLAFVVIALLNVIRNIFQGKDRKDSGMHLVNLMFSLTTTGIFFIFIMTILIGAFAILAPLLGAQ